jgi:hypothetical protein
MSHCCNIGLPDLFGKALQNSGGATGTAEIRQASGVMTTLRGNELPDSGSRTRAYLDHPAFPAAVSVAAAICFVLLRLEFFAHGDLTRFIDAGRSFVNPSQAPRNLHIVSGTGYDGEFYYRLALDPANLHRTAFGITFDNASRVQRIMYSTIVWVVAGGGRQGIVPVALVIVNIVGFGVLGWLGAMVAKDAKRPAVYGLLLSGYFGFLFSLGRDLTEISAASFLLAGIVALRRDRPVLAGFLLAAAALSRETALAFAVALGLVCVADILRHRRGPARRDFAWLIPGSIYVAWQLVGWSVYGVLPLRADAGDNLRLPFSAMVPAIAHFIWTLPNAHSAIWLGELIVLTSIAVLAGLSLRNAKVRRWEKAAWVLAVLVVISLAPGIWRGEADFRGFEDLYVLSSVILIGSKRNLTIPVVLVGVAWAVTFVHRALFF